MVGPMMGGCNTMTSMTLATSSMPMSMSMPMSKPMATPSMTGTPTMSSMSMTSSMVASSSPAYNAANGIVPSNIGTALGALIAAVGLFAL